MSMTTATDTGKSSLWSGGLSPYRSGWGKVMMWFFLVSDAFTFAALLISYGTIRFAHETWANPNEAFSAFPGLGHAYLPLMFVSLMTFILIMSSVTMVLGVRSGQQKDRSGVVKWLFFTILGGIAFLSCQAWEWTHLITGGTTISGNPFGPAAFGQFFFLITGFHGFHVFTGVLINIIVFINVIRRMYDRTGNYQVIENIGLYWHFVDLVWVFVFAAFYLLSAV